MRASILEDMGCTRNTEKYYKLWHPGFLWNSTSGPSLPQDGGKERSIQRKLWQTEADEALDDGVETTLEDEAAEDP
jgi:hypothetical protein